MFLVMEHPVVQLVRDRKSLPFGRVPAIYADNRLGAAAKQEAGLAPFRCRPNDLEPFIKSNFLDWHWRCDNVVPHEQCHRLLVRTIVHAAHLPVARRSVALTKSCAASDWPWRSTAVACCMLPSASIASFGGSSSHEK